MNHEITKSDVIIVCGSGYLPTADRGAELLLNGYADLLVFSGKHGRKITFASGTEAEVLGARAVELGVSPSQILLETQATNTGENMVFSYQLLQEYEIDVGRIILLHKPYIERRAYATFCQQRPGLYSSIIVTSPQVSIDEYAPDHTTMERLLYSLVGSVQRIIDYPQQGFQIYQEVPDEVMDAYQQLSAMGYGDHDMG